MDTSTIVFGKHAQVKRERARQFRREMTPHEASLWEKLKADRLGGFHFRRQQIIDGFIADFYGHSAGVIVEVDGNVHDNQRDYDALRDRLLTARQLVILRFANDRIRDEMPGVLDEILDTVRGRSPIVQTNRNSP